MIKVRVPATTANIGPGFDCLGMALSMYNDFFIEEIEEGLVIEGCLDKYKNEDNLVYYSMKKLFHKVGYSKKGIKIRIEGQIPESRGLGSSASCIVGGILGANEIAGTPLNQNEILELATEIEGHPDNIAPAIFGGMVVSVYEDNKVYYNKIGLLKDLKLCALVPEFTLSTEKSRNILPKNIDYKDGVFNIGRTALMISALVSGNLDLIKLGCQDKLHQQYRGSLIENYTDIVSECEKYSLGTFLSGAGPTIMSIIKEDDNKFARVINDYLKELNNKWEARELKISFNGATVEKF